MHGVGVMEQQRKTVGEGGVEEQAVPLGLILHSLHFSGCKRPYVYRGCLGDELRSDAVCASSPLSMYCETPVRGGLDALCCDSALPGPFPHQHFPWQCLAGTRHPAQSPGGVSSTVLHIQKAGTDSAGFTNRASMGVLCKQRYNDR